MLITDVPAVNVRFVETPKSIFVANAPLVIATALAPRLIARTFVFDEISKATVIANPPVAHVPATTLIVPPYVPAGRPAGFAVTSTLPGVVPRGGLNCSQLPGDVAVKLTCTFPLANAKLCGAGVAPPVW